MSNHTPPPWKIGSGDDYYIRAEAYPREFIGHFKSDDNGPYVAYIGNRPADFGEANAAFIVKAVNNHEKLVAALTSIAEWRKVDLRCEYEHGLRDAIRSMADCAAAALDAQNTT